MNKFSKSNIQINNSTKNVAKVTIKPLNKGFGVTLGNALRRTLLSSIPGASIFAIKTDGVKHEYDAVPGIKEDGVQFVLNVKKLVIKLDTNVLPVADLEKFNIENWPVLTINFKGKGKVTGADVVCPSGFEVVNKDVVLATSDNDNCKLNVSLYANYGFGFSSHTQNKELINSIGIVPVDSSYSPVLSVGYNVEEIVVGKGVVSDELTLNVATNGAISPADAVSVASRILIEHLTPLASSSDVTMTSFIAEEPVANEVVEPKQKSIPIEELNLETRANNGLKRNGILTVQQLLEKTKQEITEIKFLGKKSIREIIQRLKQQGYELKK